MTPTLILRGGRLVGVGLVLALGSVACEGSQVVTPMGPMVGNAGGSPNHFIMDGRVSTGVPAGRSRCWDLAWACWPMPNPAGSGLPNPARYDTRATEVVVDEVTTLMWQRRAFDETPQLLAQELCAGLVLGGYDDWRLPARIELLSLVDFARPSPAIDGDAFPGTIGNFWTSSPVLDSGAPAGAWQVSFSDGGATIAASDTSMGGVRCVRAQRPAGQPFGRYNLGNLGPDETATDVGTGLVWRRAPLVATHTYGEAQLQCGAAGFGWRVPSVKELQTLVDEEKSGPPYIDETVFSGTAAGPAPFWTSSRSGDVPNAAWFVDFATGAAAAAAPVAGDLIDQRYPVRCVR
jgi:hypothetical protein